MEDVILLDMDDSKRDQNNSLQFNGTHGRHSIPIPGSNCLFSWRNKFIQRSRIIYNYRNQWWWWYWQLRDTDRFGFFKHHQYKYGDKLACRVGPSSYNLQWKTSSSSTWTTVSGITTTPYNLTGLTAGTVYQFQVQTVCSAGGTSSYSALASFTTTGTTRWRWWWRRNGGWLRKKLLFLDDKRR